MPVNVLASEQSKATAETADKIIKLLNYCTTHPEAKLQYHALDMILNIPVTHHIFQKEKPRSDEDDSSTWTAT
jgi:hypothetical protein